MKKHLFTFSLLITACLGLRSQVVPNGGFESWNVTNYQDPSPWWDSNQQTLQKGGPANTSTVTGFVGKAVHMQTYIIGADTFPSYIVNTNSDIFNGQGGLPYSQKPTGITGYYRYNLPGQDTALLLVFFKKSGSVVAQNFIKIRGTGSQPTFTSFNYSLSLSVVPDTVIIASSCSNAVSMIGVQNGSFMELDNLAFTGPGITQPIVNGDFENWTSATFNWLNNWATQGDGIGRSTTAPYAGSVNLSLTTLTYNGNQVYPSSITNGYFSQSNGPKGGRPYTLMMDTLIGYFKYSGVTADSGAVAVQLSNSGNQIGGNVKFFPHATTWTQFKVPINSMSAPDTMRIDAYSSKWPVVAGASGSVLQLDNMYLKSNPLGIRENDMISKGNICYPNPANTVLNILLSKPVVADGEVNVIDLSGKVVLKNSVRSGQDKLSINTRDLPAGAYYFTIESGTEIITNKFIKE